MSKFIEVIGHGNRWALNIENIQCVQETRGGNALVFFGEDDCIELKESYDHFLNRLAEVTEVTEL